MNRSALLETIGKARLATPKGHVALPIISNVLLRARGNTLTATGTDLETALVVPMEAMVTKPGAIVAPVKALESFLKAVKAEIVTLIGEGKSLTIKANGSEATLVAFDAADFPPVPVVKGRTVEIQDLTDALAEVDYAMANEETRPVLNGTYLKPNGGNPEVAAADGFRLAIAPIAIKGKLAAGIILPYNAVRLCQRVFKGEAVRLTVGEAIAKLEAKGMTMVARLTEGNYPDYAQLVPKGGTPISFAPAELAEAIKTVMAVGSQRDPIIRLVADKGKLTASRSDEETGTIKAQIKARGEGKIAFNGSYLCQLLPKLGSKATMEITGPSAPALFRDETKAIHMLMPMFVQW